ncbi:hypothetical protein CEXT_29791 [Caerostris extrusa]|uniref:Cytochrome P450 n=1 Tax=Caerostris extrusa TaxID=172846 RepID=A0AAV4U5P2_CAEEX|nr:hypothetical protein CEXT_29791 [Caerostris extrusa]
MVISFTGENWRLRRPMKSLSLDKPFRSTTDRKRRIQERFPSGSFFLLFPESDESVFINATEGQTRVETDRDFGTESAASLIAQTPPTSRDVINFTEKNWRLCRPMKSSSLDKPFRSTTDRK